jgi:hypothetical protein
MKHTLRKRWRWQRAHTLYIVVTEAVFQAPMLALNAVAQLNACEPSHTLSKSLHCSVCEEYTRIEESTKERVKPGRDTHAAAVGSGQAGESLRAVSSAHNNTRGMSEAIGAYRGHRLHRSSVPGSDVRVERRCPPKRLRSEPRAHLKSLCTIEYAKYALEMSEAQKK